jgi:Lon protease-like protein
MDDDCDLQSFSGRCRLFPLPRVVLFPHAILPLHIFEPRYKQMTEDALADDRLVTIVQLRSSGSPPGQSLGAPPIEVVGCLGQIVQHERLADGRFNFLLLGRRRVRFRHEILSDRLYRIAEADVLEDVEADPSEESLRPELISLFCQVFERQHAPEPDLRAIVESALPLGVLTDIMAHALGLPEGFKQQLLSEPHVGPRVQQLFHIMRSVLALPIDARNFPPPFSVN